MTALENWPQLLHVASSRVFPLRLGGTTTFGRSPKFYDYAANDSLRWSRSLAEELARANYVWISETTQVSRTHGKILHIAESGTLIYQDLKSTNGSFVNFQRLEPSEETIQLAQAFQQSESLPTARLEHGDLITIGGESFAIELVNDPLRQLARTRCALLVEGTGQSGAEVFRPTLELLERKGFEAKRILTAESRQPDFAERYARAKALLAGGGASCPEGFSLIILRGEVRDGRLELGDVTEEPVQLLRFLDEVPGCKVIALQSIRSAEPFTSFVQRYGYRDTILLTQRGLSLEAAERDPDGPPLVTPEDDVNAALDALIDPRSPSLRIEALKPLSSPDAGRLALTIGDEMRPLESYGGISHSLDLNVGSSLACSLRSQLRPGGR